MTSGNRWRLIGWGAAAALLAAPAIAMQVTDEVAWDWFDFLVAGALLLGVGGGLELLARRGDNGWHRAGAATALLAALLLVWVNAAVGIVGAERDDANLMYLAVLGIGAAGSAVGRFEPAAMAAALIATAAAQVAVGAVALAGGMGAGAAAWPWDVVGLTGGLTALWLAAAALFARAARVSARISESRARAA